MPQVTVLSAKGQKRFDQPPLFNKEERRRYFHLTSDVRAVVSNIRKPVNRAGFLLQLAYFQAAGRFFSIPSFRSRDIKHVQRVFKLDDVDLSSYGDRMATHHRNQICSILNWNKLVSDP